MQNLILDFGNTRFKAAIFEHGKVIHRFSEESLQIETLKSLKIKYPNLKKAIYSTVVDLHPELKKHLHTVFDILELTENEVELAEGLYHRGKSSVICFVGRKKQT